MLNANSIKLRTIHPTDTLLNWIKTALSEREKAMLSHLDGARKGDVEAIHDLRVNARRLHAILKIFQKYFPKKNVKAYSRMLREVIRAMGRVREQDVIVAMLQEFQATLSPADQVSIEPLLTRKLRAGSKRHRKLLPYLKDLERKKYRLMFRKTLKGADPLQ